MVHTSEPPPVEEAPSTQTRRLGTQVAAMIELGLDETIPATMPYTPPPRVAEEPRALDSVDLVLDEAPAAKPPTRKGSISAELAPPARPAPDPDPRVPLTDEPAPAPAIYVPGDVIDGKYRLTRIIGRGGMGAVWLAHNLPLDMDVAVKLIRRDRTAPEAAGRLLQEARAAARLKHPSIVRVFDFGESEQGDPFIVMELLNGESFAAILRRKKRLSPAIAVQTLLPVASALASAHSKGIVHRDLKPDNVLLITDESGALVPKVVDFGIAKLLSNDPDRPFTLAGEVLGSPDYMSPEQARGADNVGEATDIWAFSVVLYESVAGRRPFEGPNYNSLIAAILTNDPPPIDKLSDPALWAILQRGLTKNVAVRWASMRELGAALAQWAVDQGIEEDVCGNRIAKQWLEGAMRRIFTVYPEQNEVSDGIRPAAGGGAGATNSVLSTDAKAGGARGSAGSPVDTRSSRRARRPGVAFWIGLLAPVVVGIGVLGYLTRATFPAGRPTPIPAAIITASSIPVTTAESAAVTPALPTALPTTDAAPSASPAPSTSASAKGPKVLKPPIVDHKKAPSVPKSITF
ncbi:MAG: serine/threonine-protein kinase [Byssovorax sp.]